MIYLLRPARLGFVTLLLSTVLGCGPEMAWHKPGSTRDDFFRDRYVCQQQSSMHPVQTCRPLYGGGIQCASAPDATIFSSCMQARGYSFTPVLEGETVGR